MPIFTGLAIFRQNKASILPTPPKPPKSPRPKFIGDRSADLNEGLAFVGKFFCLRPDLEITVVNLKTPLTEFKLTLN